ncbi:MAG: MBOAT family protein [Lachnospiraceae bacterium]|nr:MBOAT family protein [Lachnospiraceae bacterium]
MLFNSFHFLLFFPIVVLLYFLIPKSLKNLWLLAASCYFYISWNAKYMLLLFFSTAVTYASGLLLAYFSAKNSRKWKKIIVGISFFLNLSLLFWFKYFDFIIVNINRILSGLHMRLLNPAFDILLPVGISFYIFQALSYTMDVYREETKVERNFMKYALFVSFFPQLVAGPIERSKNLLCQLGENHSFEFERVREGLLLMLWGYFLKLAVADRIAVVVDTVYGDYAAYGGGYLVVASVLFAFQIYGDFAGYSTIAAGAAQVMGFHLMENFDCPYFSQSVSEFWRRWHISLSTWFRDYLYIPLGGNRKGTLRKQFNILVVFLMSGLWHGAQWSFVVWGGLNGVFQIAGDCLKPVRDKLNRIFCLDRDTLGHKAAKVFVTFLLVDFTWVFFRADQLKDAFLIIKSILSVHNPWIFFDNSLYDLGLSRREFQVMLFSTGILLVSDFLKYRGIRIRKVIVQQELWCRWLCYISAVMFVLLFGVWGSAYNESSFIYFQF